MAAPPTTAIRNPSGITSEGARGQYGSVTTLFSGVDTAGSGPPIDVSGLNGALTLEVFKTGTGTCDIEVEETMDSASVASDTSPWQDTRMNVLGSAGNLTPIAGVNSIGAGTVVRGLAILDAYPTQRVTVENVAGTVSVRVRLYSCPQ